MPNYLTINKEKFETTRLKSRYINSPYFRHYDHKIMFKAPSTFFRKYDKARRSIELDILYKRLNPYHVDQLIKQSNTVHKTGILLYWCILLPLSFLLSIIGVILFFNDKTRRNNIHEDFIRALQTYKLNPDLPNLYQDETVKEIYM